MNLFLAPLVVLVVEDTVLIRMGIVETLQDAGCETMEADGGVEALSLVTQRSDICVLFSNVGAPGPHDGLELARQVHAIEPHIQLILTSGRGAPADADMPPGAWFVPKPYSAIDLTRRISSIRG